MKQCFKVISILATTIFIYALPANADTVLLHNGDRLIGTIQNSYFALQGPYGQIVIKKDFLKRISISDSQQLETILQTINNDLFNGTVLNIGIQIQLQNRKCLLTTYLLDDLLFLRRVDFLL